MDGSQPGASAPLRPLSLRVGRPHGVKKHLRVALATAAEYTGNDSHKAVVNSPLPAGSCGWLAVEDLHSTEDKSFIPNKFHKCALSRLHELLFS